MVVASKKYFFLYGLLVLICFGCENDPADVEALIKETREVEEAKNIKATFSQSGKLKAILEAPIMYRVKADTIYTEFPESIHVAFYNEAGAIDNIVQAKYAKYYEMLHKVYMRDSVVVYNTTDTLYAMDMWWDQNQEIFYSTNPVRVRTISQKLNGTGIRAKSDFTKYSIENPVGPIAIPQEISPN